MAGIGTLTFTGMRGTLQGPRSGVDTFTRPGVSGAGVLVDAAHPVAQQIETVTADTAANCAIQLAAAEDLVGTIVAVTDDFGDSLNHCAILGVSGSIKAATGSAAAVLTMRWTILADHSP
jgi:hypothetical protein